jgi:hypothetical protein
MSKHQASDEKLMARERDFIVPSKKVTTCSTTEAAPKAAPKDVDAAGDVERSDDSDTANSEKDGTGSDTSDSNVYDPDNNAVEDSDDNAHEGETNSGEEEDSVAGGEEEGHPCHTAGRRSRTRTTRTPSLLPTNRLSLMPTNSNL